MAASGARPSVLVIVGQTASGKSDLAMSIAKKLDGEIIAADSRTVYKGMDVGTAKPTPTDQKAVKHWGLDLVEPGKSFSAAQYKKYAQAKITDIHRRKKLPILAGGTGLYIDSLIFDFSFKNAPNAKLRQQLDELSVSDLQSEIQRLNLEMPYNSQNRRHLIRTLESAGVKTEQQSKPLSGTLIVGLQKTPLQLQQRISARIEGNFENLINETKKLLNTYSRGEFEKTAGIPYSAAIDYIDLSKSKAQALQMIKTAEWQYARRQKTWFRRNKFINWFDSDKKAEAFILQQFDV